jgi:uncharacterized protein (DUF4415 family)
MKEKRTGRTSVRVRTDWNKLQSLTDRQIRRGIETDPDVQPTDAAFWRSAKVVMPQPKETITIRLDADLLEWLRRQKGYQTRINAVLRTYMEANAPARRSG